MHVTRFVLVLLLTIVSAHDSAAQAAHGDTIRLDVGSKLVDGRVYKPHAARVRIFNDAGQTQAEWVNVLEVVDSGGHPYHKWLTTGSRVTPAGDTIKWELRQTYDGITLAPYTVHRQASNGASVLLRVNGARIIGESRTSTTAQPQTIAYDLPEAGFVGSASDIVPAAVGFRKGRVISAPIWEHATRSVERRTFTIIGQQNVDVEGTAVNAWKVEERREADGKLLATWYLLGTSPYMVYGEVPLPNGGVQRMTEVEVRK